MKRCSKCGLMKESADFSAHPHTKDRLQSWCRKCTRVARRKTKKPCLLCEDPVFRQGLCSSHFHRLQRYGDPLAGGTKKAKVSKADRMEYVRNYKLEHGCADCGYNAHPAALDFDHLPGSVKVRDIKSGQQLGWVALLEEIAKCEVVCANCHRIRTVERREEVMPMNTPKTLASNGR